VSGELTATNVVAGLRARDRTMLARAVTLVESRRSDHRAVASEVVAELAPTVGAAVRVGITGVPGVGKSTFIDQFGINLTAAGHRVAVLAVDPTSQRTGGSILGDKTRMERLAVDPNAFIRPSPAGATLGGVTRTTREAMILCEAAGFDVILVETVGVGQSETVVAEMVDFFLVLMLSGAGDDLQGIKKGVLELADAVAVNKADGDNIHRANSATPSWTPPVLTCSSLHNESLDELWQQIQLHRAKLDATGELTTKRQGQQVRWMWAMIADRLTEEFRSAPAVGDQLRDIESQVRDANLPATIAADRLLEAFLSSD